MRSEKRRLAGLVASGKKVSGMDLSNILREQCIELGVSAEDKDGILSEIAGVAKRSPVCRSATHADICGALEAREALATTGFGNHIAIPHCTLKGVDDFLIGIVTSETGVEFSALDELPVRLFVFIISPDLHRSRHIRILATISQVLQSQSARDSLLSESDPEGLRDRFLRYCRRTKGSDLP